MTDTGWSEPHWVIPDNPEALAALYAAQIEGDFRPYEHEVELTAAELALLQNGHAVVWDYNGWEIAIILRFQPENVT